MRKSMKKILLSFVFIIMMVMATQKSYAAFLEDKYFFKNQYSGTFSILLEDLESSSNWNMLCSEHGQHIPSSNNIGTVYSGSFNDHSSVAGTVDFFRNYSSTSETCSYVGKKYHSEDAAYYSIISTQACQPKAAYVFNHMQEGVNSYGTPDNYTDIQKAWYNIIQGASYGSTLYKTANSYQTFIKKIVKEPGNVANPSTYVDTSHTYEDGTNVSVKFPEINKEKVESMLAFNTLDNKGNIVKKGNSDWAKNVKVEFDKNTQKYKFGPFSINYEEASADGVDFGAICGFDIYTDASSEPVAKDKWRFIWQNAHKDDFAYPHSNDVFYIEMDYIENATMVTGMDIDYKYLVAGAEYQTLSGTYSQYSWEVQKVGDTWKFVARKQNIANASQTLALVDKAARWYEVVKIEKRAKDEPGPGQHEGSIVIRKVVLDENGKQMTSDEAKAKFSGARQFFNFAVKLTYSDGKKDTLYTSVEAGEAVRVGPISWEGNTAPTYEVIEIPATDGSWKQVSINNETGSLQANNTVEIMAQNQITKKYSNRIKIDKTISGVADHDETFKFKLRVTYADGTQAPEEEGTIVVKKGTLTAEWTSKEYEWYGEKAPTYEVIEVETEDSKRYNSHIPNSKGELDDRKVEIVVTAMNNKIEELDHVGYLTFEKALLDGQVTNDTFDFRVTVNGVSTVESGVVSFDVTGVKAGEKKGPYAFVWKGDVAPTYTIEEININSNEEKVSKIEAIVIDKDGNAKKAGEQNGNKITGTLVADGEAKIDVKFTNDMTKHSGGLKVEKDIETTEKISKDTLASEGIKFDVEVVISGTFVHNGKTYQNSTEVIKKSLPEDGKWSFEISGIEWYGESTPSFTVKEINIPKGWRLKGITYSDVEDKTNSDEGINLIDGKTINAKIINELPSTTLIDLTFSMSGIVWIDETLDAKNDDEYYNAPNGVYDEGETLKENAEVTVYKVIYDASGKEVSREVATAYKDTSNNEIKFPIVTNSDGKWNVPRIAVPTVSEEQKAKGYTAGYDVEFVYDGQTYEPTDFLAYQVKGNEKTKNKGSNAEKAKEYINAKTSVKDRYAKDSMALAIEQNKNNVITNVAGKSEIDSNGDSTGVATLADGRTVDIKYHAENAGDEYPVRSELVTTNENGLVLDMFKSAARTSAGNLTFPFDVDGYDGSSLTNVDTTINEYGIERKYKFMAVYNYCLNINLGLKQRATADVALNKTLDNAKVIVKEKLYQYNYSGHFDLTEEKLNSLDHDIKVESGDVVEGKLGLYRSDYYYRAEMYKTGTSDGIYDKLDDFYKTMDKSIKDTEMDIYLTYKIKIENSSSRYDVKVDSIDDYYDSSFSLVTEDVTKYLKTQTIGGKETDVNSEVKIADAFNYEWQIKKEGLVGTDKDKDDANVRYNKMTIENLNFVLTPGEQKELLITFKVNKEKDKEYGVEDSVILGLKCNVAEIANYTTYYTGTKDIAGKIDRDSAPGNVSIITNNSKKWYEDDTFAAPKVNINLVAAEDERTIVGTAFEDNSKDTNTENPGYNQQVGNGIKEDNEVGIEGLSTELVEKVMVPDATAGTYTEYDYTWPTSEKLDCLNGHSVEEVSGLDSTITTEAEGKYAFNNVAAGDYVVRFTYGDDSSNKIESADYSTAKYYNGQDYKSSNLRANVKGGMPQKYVKADSYLDIEETNKNDVIKNTAIDNEVRRLQVVEKSRTIDYNNGIVMAEYRDGLFDDYDMFADTLKLDMNIEIKSDMDLMETAQNKDDYKYEVRHIDFGLEERPITQITLDNQIEEITITTSDGNRIMDAKYIIDYDINPDTGEITAKVELDPKNSYGTENLQALNRDLATNQGFRYIAVDNDILEGTTVSVKYRFTAINSGEVDRTGLLADTSYDWDNGGFRTICDDLATKLATYTRDGDSLKNDNEIGHFVGSIYYLGTAAVDPTDSVVTSRVRQVVDYVDNDVVFDGMINSVPNMSWSNVKVTELDGHMEPSIITSVDGQDVILDEDEISYETNMRNNIVASVDNDNKGDKINNGEFIVHLTPAKASNDTAPCSSSMNLTITKYVGADSDDLEIDNIAEIIRYENIVGRRDELTVPTNQDPAKALETDISLSTPTTVSAGMVYERDTSATEVITLSPPTGSSLKVWKAQVAVATLAGLVILCGGIVWIKKKVLK